MSDEVREDDIILAIVREQGCSIPASVKSIADLDASLFFHICSTCLSLYHQSRNDGVPNYPTKLPGGKAQQFRIGTSMAEDCKKMGYAAGEIGYEAFLYPSEQSMKKLLRFLIDKLPKPENETSAEEGEQSAHAGSMVNVKNILKSWVNKEWNADSNATTQHTIRTTHLSLPQSTTTNKDALKYYATKQPLVTQQPRSFSSFIPSILAAHSLELVRKENVVDEFDRKQKNSEATTRIQTLVKSAFNHAIRSHDQYLASSRDFDLSSYSNAATSGRSAFARRNYFENDRTEVAAPIVSATSPSAASPSATGPTPEEKEAALRAERERQLAELQRELDELHESTRAIDTQSELIQTQTRQLENEYNTLLNESRELEDQYLIKKRTLDLLPDAVNNLKELQALVESSKTRLLELGQEWEEYRQPLLAKLRRAKQLFHERKLELSSKIEKIKRMREEMKEKANDLREKEKLSKILTEEYNSLPKSINRQIYVKRIMDLMKNIDKQSAQIKSILKDVKQVQKDINLTSEQSKRSFAIADEVVFQSAKKNPKEESMMRTYKYVVNLREGFVELVSGVEMKGKIENEIMTQQTQLDDLEGRNSHLNMERMEQDLAVVKKENKELTQQIKQMKQ